MPRLRAARPGLEERRSDLDKGKGKALIGALNYLSSKGMNAMSFLPYNAGGDGDNVWPFVDRDDKFHYDVSKLDQWQIVFDHAQAKGIYLHFKLQEQENDDGTRRRRWSAVDAAAAGGGRAVARGRPVVRRPRKPHRAAASPPAAAPAGRRQKAAAPGDEERTGRPVPVPRRSTVATPGASAGSTSVSWSRGSATSSRSTGTWARRTPRRRCSSAR